MNVLCTDTEVSGPWSRVSCCALAAKQRVCSYGVLVLLPAAYLVLTQWDSLVAVECFLSPAAVAGTSRYPWRYPQPPNWLLWQLDQTSDDSVKARLRAPCGVLPSIAANEPEPSGTVGAACSCCE